MEKKFETPAIIELFGKTRIAGIVTEQNIGGSTFIRVDVPGNNQNPPITRLLNPSAIYAINPVTEEVMVEMAKAFEVKPIHVWDIREHFQKTLAQSRQDAGFDTSASGAQDDLEF